MRGLVYNNKLVHGIMSGTDLFGHQNKTQVKHFLVSILDCSSSKTYPCNGYVNVKAFEFDRDIGNINIKRIQDVPFRNFDKTDVFCVPVQGLQQENEPLLMRSWFVPGAMNKNKT